MENKNEEFVSIRPCKKVSFVVYFPYQWFIYKNIYHKLPADKREVIVDLNASPILQDNEVMESIVSLLGREGVVFRELERAGYFNAAYFSEFFSTVEVIVSCWELGCVSSEYTAHIKKVNMTYGLAKELTMLRPTRSVYDVILAYGKRDQKLFSLFTKSVAIGNPRLDNFYNGVIGDSVRMRFREFFRDPAKKIVVYVPTHGDLGSFREMLNVFERLSGHYNIIFKPHYYTLREERDIVEKYRQIKGILVIDDVWDTIEVMAAADIIVSDSSSSVFDAMQVDKPIIMCDFLTRHFLDVIHKNLRFIKRGIVGASTYSESFEQEIKNKGLIATIKKPDDLDGALKNIEEIDKRYAEFRRKIVRENFEYTDGRSAERAADVIMRTYDAERNHIRGVLYHAYLAYNNRIYRGLVESEDKEISLAPVSSRTIVWILCDSGSDHDEVLGTIYSALNEKEAVSICVSGDVAEKDLIGIFSEEDSLQRISFFDDHSAGLDFVYSQLDKVDALLLAKPNTQIEDLKTVFNYKISCKRDMIFFSENVVFDPDDRMSRLFYLLKSEILGFRSLSKNVLLPVSREQIYSLEKSAAFMDSKTLLGHGAPMNDLSFEGIFSFFIGIDSLKSNEQHGIPLNDFILLPNFFMNIRESDGRALFNRLAEKWARLYRLGIPSEKWPDNRPGKFLLQILSGNFQYYWILKLLSFKLMSIRKYIFLGKAQVFLSQKLTEKND